LSTRARLVKAQRLTVQFLATSAFFFASLQAKVEALNLPPAPEDARVGQSFPALYLARVVACRTSGEARHRLRALSVRLLAPLRQPAHPLQARPPAQRERYEQVNDQGRDFRFGAMSDQDWHRAGKQLFHKRNAIPLPTSQRGQSDPGLDTLSRTC
jgi:hypothetical protein